MRIPLNPRLALALAAGIGVAFAQSSVAQTGPRDLAAQRFVLDDGTGNTFSLTLQVPVLTGNVTLNFPTALGTAYFILSNSVSGQTINGPLTLDGGTNLTLTNPLRAIDGGTGFDTYTTGDLLFANSTTTLQQLGIGTAGQMLISNGTTPNWSNSPTIIGGTIDNTPIGATTPNTGAFTNLSTTGTTTLGNGVGLDNVTVNTNGGNLQLTVGGGLFSLSNSTGLNVATDGTLNDATGDFTIADALTQTGGGQVTFSGNVDANNGLDVTGANLTVGGGNFTVDVASGNVATSGTLTVASTTTLNGNTFIGNGNDDVSVNTGTGNFSVSNGTGLNVATTGTLSDATGNLTVNDNLDVTGSTALGDGAGTDNLTVNTNGGSISMAAAGGTFALSNTTGLNVATDGTLTDATGTLTANDDFAVNQSTTLGDGAGTDNLTVTTNGGNISMAAAGGNFSVSNTTGLNVSTTGTLNDATGNLTVNDDLDVTGSTALGDGAGTDNLTVNTNGGSISMAAVGGNFSVSNTTGLNVSTTGTLNDASGDLTSNDNFVPAADNTFSLGTDALRWSELFVNGASVHIGPTGGESGNTEMNLGYAANTGSININGGGTEIDVTTGATDVNNNLDANSGVDVTGADLTVGGANFTVTVGSGNTAVGGTLTVTGATNLNGAVDIGNGADNVNINAGSGTFQLSSSQLNVITSGDISDLGGPVTVADGLSQTGAGQVTFSGNVDANSGVDVTGASLTVGGANFTVATSGNVDANNGVDVTGASLTVGGANFSVTTAGVITAAGAGSSIGSNANVVQLTVDGSGAGATTNTLDVDGRANVVGDAVLNRNVTYSTGTVAAGATITIPANMVMVQVTNDGAGAANAVTLPAGVAGRVLYIFNDDAQALTGGATTAAGATDQFIFLGGAWRLVN